MRSNTSMKLAALLLSASMLLTACGGSKTEAAQTSAAPAASSAAAADQTAQAAGGGTTEAAGKTAAAKPASSAGNQAAKGDTWTVMLYLDGTDLESESSQATNNLREILQTEPSDKVKLVIQTGGTKEWHCENLGVEIDPGKLQRYLYTPTGLELKDEQPLAPMNDKDTLASFISYCAEAYPAERYMLVMWDHGGGTANGMVMDELYPDNGLLSVKNFGEAIKASGVHFDTVITDMCLMSSVECAQALAPYADYYIGSEENAAGTGTAFTEWMEYLYENPGCTSEQFGKVFCGAFQRKYKALNDSMSQDSGTFAMLDLSKIGAVNDALEAMFAEIDSYSGDIAHLTQLASAVNKADTYNYGTRLWFGMVDLADFAVKAREAGLSKQVSNDVVNAVNDAVVCKVTGSEHSYSYGISFYYCPEAPVPELLDNAAEVITSPSLLAYYDMLRDDWEAPAWVYEKIKKPEIADRSDLELKYEVEYSEEVQPQIHITSGMAAVTQIDAQFYRMNEETESWYLLGTDFALYGDVNENIYRASFDGQWYTIGDVPAALQITKETDSQVNLTIPVKIADESDSNVGYLSAAYYYYTPLDEQDQMAPDFSGEFDVMGFVASARPSMPARTTLTLMDLAQMDATITLLAPLCDFEDDLSQAAEYGTIKADAFLNVGAAPLAEGYYAVSFEIHDVFGNRKDTQLIPIYFDGKDTIRIPE